MLNVMLVDDEIAALEELAYQLSAIGGVHIIGKYENPLQALAEIKEQEPDAVFLDIEMREIDGFTLAYEILQMKKQIEIVFVTAYGDYAVRAFEINAVDYVLKPLGKERLKLAVNKLLEKKKGMASKSQAEMGMFIQEQKLRQSVKKVPVWKENIILLLDPHEILYLTTKAGEVNVVTRHGWYQSRDTLSFWEEKLRDVRFFRTHKNFLVNLDKVRQAAPFFNYTYILKLDGMNEEIPVSRNYLKGFKRLMML